MRYEFSFVGFLVLLTAGQVFADPPKDSLNNPNADVPAAPRRPVSEKQRLSLVEKGKGLRAPKFIRRAAELLATR